MIAFFPTPYPDELFYSVVSRYYAHSGFPSYNMVLGELMKNGYTRVDPEFGISGLNDEVRQFLDKQYGLIRLIKDNSMFPLYSKFVSASKREEALKVLCTGEGDIRNCLPFPTSKHGKRYMRYCPECAKDDREKYGETYWHRIHQIRGVNACSEHRCRLINTDIELNAKKSLRLYIAEEIAVNSVADPANKIEIDLAHYATQLLQIELKDGERELGEWLVSKLEGSPYISARGKRKYIAKLFEDISKFYMDISEPSYTKPHQLQKVFMGYNQDFMPVCQLAMFLGIPVEEFRVMAMPEQSITERFNAEVERLYKSGLGCHRIARKVGSSPSTALKANRITEKADHDYAVRKGMKRQNWEEMDQDMLPKVRALCEKIYTGNGGRPKRVTAFAINRAMGWPDKRLDYLPMCAEVIREYSQERIEEYWARECVWAYKKLQKEVATVHWRQLRDMTNMRRMDFERCKEYLDQYAYPDIANKIKNLT